MRKQGKAVVPVDLLGVVIGTNMPLRAVNNKFGLSLMLPHVIVLYAIRSFNAAGVKIGQSTLRVFFNSNARGRGPNYIQARMNDLIADGLIRKDYSRAKGSVHGLSLTVDGLHVLESFEKYLAGNKLKGLPEL